MGSTSEIDFGFIPDESTRSELVKVYEMGLLFGLTKLQAMEIASCAMDATHAAGAAASRAMADAMLERASKKESQDG